MTDLNTYQNKENNSYSIFPSYPFEENQSSNASINNRIIIDCNNNININLLDKDKHNNNIENENKNLTNFNDNFVNTAKNIENKNTYYYLNNNEKNVINFDSIKNKINTNIIQDINLKSIESKFRKERIFKIGKKNKNTGRIKKNTHFFGKHNKFCEDNIIRKIKGRFLEKCRIYINNEYKRFLLNSKHEIQKANDFLQRITPKLSRKIKKVDNLSWLNSKLYQVYSENLSEKCSLYDPEYNKKKIKKLYEENKAKNVIDILNKTVKEIFEAFTLNTKITGFETLNDDLKELKLKMEKDNQENIDQYLYKYRNIALNFESIFINKTSRSNKKNF